MTQNSTQGGTTSSINDEELFKRDPAKYYYIAAKKSEVGLMFLDAADLYLAAYTEAVKAKSSIALQYKWMSMRCIEYDAIYERLKKQMDPQLQFGRVLSDGSVMISWYCDNMVVPEETLKAYKQHLPKPDMHYNALIWDRKKHTMRFLKTDSFFEVSEPCIKQEFYVDSKGNLVETEHRVDPPILLHKWMLTKQSPYNQQDRNAQIRRSIRIEYLKLPKEMVKGDFPHSKFWDTFVVPAIGNRSIGKLHQQYLDTLKK